MPDTQTLADTHAEDPAEPLAKIIGLIPGLQPKAPTPPDAFTPLTKDKEASKHFMSLKRPDQIQLMKDIDPTLHQQPQEMVDQKLQELINPFGRITLEGMKRSARPEMQADRIGSSTVLNAGAGAAIGGATAIPAALKMLLGAGSQAAIGRATSMDPFRRPDVEDVSNAGLGAISGLPVPKVDKLKPLLNKYEEFMNVFKPTGGPAKKEMIWLKQLKNEGVPLPPGTTIKQARSVVSDLIKEKNIASQEALSARIKGVKPPVPANHDFKDVLKAAVGLGLAGTGAGAIHKLLKLIE